METALRQLRLWRQGGLDLTMAVNLSTRNLLLPGCSAHLKELIVRAQVDPAAVELEITETALMSEPDAALDTLRQVTADGTHLAVDDFGTGYSSLVYLRRLPLDTLKIDRAFVADMLRDRQSFAIVESTIHLAHNLGLTVVAEGVEDQATADALREAGCDQAQGFHFARPAPADEVERWLEQRRTPTGSA
jgi:EAL domain-containing protein (putative c-di-GMP-specific phosphodiesterase class I)